MNVKNHETLEIGDSREVSADVDGFRLWFRVPASYQVSSSGDPFLAAALLPAMRQGEPLEMDQSIPVSPKLLQNAIRLQQIHHSWNPQLRIVPIYATVSTASPLNTGTFSFFSGGVDSMYTFLARAEEITHAVNIHGFDFSFGTVNGEAHALSLSDLKDLSQFVGKLMQPSGPVSAYLKGRLSPDTLAAASKYQESGSSPAGVETGLLRDLNKSLVEQPLYDTERFAGVTLRDKTRELLARKPSGTDLWALNRLLLEDAYPREIAGKYSGAYQTIIDRNSRFVRSFGKTLINVETNHYSFGYRYNLSRNLTQGSALASIALLLGFPRVYIPSACSYSQLFPVGSHPLTDPLYSTESVEIIHHGCEARRVDKVRAIAACEPALKSLSVCFDNPSANCGRCAKCLRTMIPLYLMNAQGVPFPPLPETSIIRKLSIGDDIEMVFFKENYDLALQEGNLELRKALRACMRAYEMRKLIEHIDRVLFSSFTKNAYRKIAKHPSPNRRIDTTPAGI